MKTSLRKTAILGLLMTFSVTSGASAASVAGNGYWDLLDEEETLTRENPFAWYGGIKYELNKFSRPRDYPSSYHENEHMGTIYAGFSWLFADNWKLNGYVSGERQWRQNKKTKNEGTVSGNIDGKIGVVGLAVGGLPVFDALNLSSGGLVVGSGITGGKITVPVGDWRIAFTGGSIDYDDYDYTRIMRRNIPGYDEDSTYLSLEGYGDIGKKVSAAVGVYNIENDWQKGIYENGNEKNNTIVSAGVDYKFTDKWTLGGIYAAGSAKYMTPDRELSNEKKSYAIQVTYGTPESTDIHNTAAWLAFRQLGRTATITPAYHGVGYGERGFELGARHMVMKNLSLEVVYFAGKKNNSLYAGGERPKVHNWYTGVEYTF